MFYVVCKDINHRNELIKHLKANNIYSVFHYLSLHKSDFYASKHDGRELINADIYTDCLLRLPLFYELKDADLDNITDEIIIFFSI